MCFIVVFPQLWKFSKTYICIVGRGRVWVTLMKKVRHRITVFYFFLMFASVVFRHLSHPGRY